MLSSIRSKKTAKVPMSQANKMDTLSDDRATTRVAPTNEGVTMKRMIRKTSQKKSRRGLRKRLSFLELVRLAVDLPLGYSPSIGNKY